ncbi:LexA family protein [Aeromonas veronii]|uniref:LexA family protein n=1 Tax=Aeromonas veronii TaxID=654 RepID=UPI003F7B1092
MYPNKHEPLVHHRSELKVHASAYTIERMVHKEKDRDSYAARLHLAADKKGLPIRGRGKILSDAIKVTPKAISKYLNDESIPTPDNGRKLADFLGVSFVWLQLGEAEADKDQELVPVPLNAIKMVPLISWVQAGEFCLSESTDFIDEDTPYYACPNSKAGPRTFALMVRGDSMTNPNGQRSYPEGTIIFVDPDHPPQAGLRVIAGLEDGSCTFKELAENETGKPYLKALNPRYTINDHVQPAKICGVVIGSYIPE